MKIRIAVSCQKKTNMSLWDDIDMKHFDNYHRIRMNTYERIKNKTTANFGEYDVWGGSNITMATEWARFHTKNILPNTFYNGVDEMWRSEERTVHKGENGIVMVTQKQLEVNFP
jgi:hypothetical protein